MPYLTNDYKIIFALKKSFSYIIKTNLNFQDRDNASEETSTITIVLLSVLGAGITFISIFAIISILKKWYVVYFYVAQLLLD